MLLDLHILILQLSNQQRVGRKHFIRSLLIVFHTDWYSFLSPVYLFLSIITIIYYWLTTTINIRVSISVRLDNVYVVMFRWRILQFVYIWLVVVIDIIVSVGWIVCVVVLDWVVGLLLWSWHWGSTPQSHCMILIVSIQ